MAKHQKHASNKEVIVPFAAGGEALLKALISEKDWQHWAQDELHQGGPPHKQAYSALVLSRMHVLVQAVEQNSKTRFAALPGLELQSAKDEVSIPIPLPFSTAEADRFDALANELSAAPAHEIILFNTLLQAIEWNINALVPAKAHS